MNVFVVREGRFYTGGWKLNTDFAFTNKDDLHKHMEKVNGFKLLPSDDQYSQEGTRFTNGNEKYGYDIVTLEVKGTPEEVKRAEVDETVLLDDLPIEELKESAKEKGIKSWHLKSRESLIEELSAKKGKDFE